MTEWLPFGYTLNQIALIVLGIWAIIQSESVIHVELVGISEGFSSVSKRFVLANVDEMHHGSSRFDRHRHVLSDGEIK